MNGRTKFRREVSECLVLCGSSVVCTQQGIVKELADIQMEVNQGKVVTNR